MLDIKNTESLMLFLINLFGEKFPQSAILKGGMALRMLDCPRYTNDIDYTFIPYDSKADVVGNICAILDDIEGLKYFYRMNSKCIRIKINYGEIFTQVEINVAKVCPSVAVSTESLASNIGQLSSIIRVMDYKVAMAHKLAAWNERGLVRDLYDLQFYYAYLKVLPDIDTLKGRLKNIQSNKRRKNAGKMKIEQLIDRLRLRLEGLSSEDINELADYLPADSLPGLEIKLRANLLKLCNDLQEVS